jgi:hypothetical protein
MCTASVDTFQNTVNGKQSPNGRKFTQSGRPDWYCQTFRNFVYLKDRLAHKRPSLNASSSAIGTHRVFELLSTPVIPLQK